MRRPAPRRAGPGAARAPAWESHPSAAALLGPLLALPALAFAVGYGVTALPAWPGRGWWQLAVLAAGVAAAVALTALPLARWSASRLVLTRGYLGVREGLVGRRERGVPLARVGEVRTVQSAWERLVGSGTLVVVPTGAGDPLVAPRLPAVRSVQALVLDLAEAAGAGDGRDDLEDEEVDDHSADGDAEDEPEDDLEDAGGPPEVDAEPAGDPADAGAPRAAGRRRRRRRAADTDA